MSGRMPNGLLERCAGAQYHQETLRQIIGKLTARPTRFDWPFIAHNVLYAWPNLISDERAPFIRERE